MTAITKLKSDLSGQGNQLCLFILTVVMELKNVTRTLLTMVYEVGILVYFPVTKWDNP